MAAQEKKGVRNPLQLLGLYLGWMESAAAVGIFATQGVDHWSRYLLISCAAGGIAIYILTASFIAIYLAIKHPYFLFNPSDYDKNVQHNLFGIGKDKLNVRNPPAPDPIQFKTHGTKSNG